MDLRTTPREEPAVTAGARPGGTVADDELLRRLATGDHDALVVLYDRYGRALYGLALRVTRHEQVAEDVVQEAFTRCWRHAGSFQASRGSVANWLLGITHNLAIDELRRANARPRSVLSLEGDDNLGPSRNAEDDAWVQIQVSAVRSALASVPPSQRTVLELAYFGGMTQTEIAAYLGEPLGTVKTRMRLGLLKLRGGLHAAGMGAGDA